MATIFVSPGVYTKEQDFSVFASRIGITRLGVVGKTLKGPAFQEIKVKSTEEFALRFGGTHPDYPLGYVANSFLGQANDLTVSRVLGRGGFTNSPAWLLQTGVIPYSSIDINYLGANYSVEGILGESAYTLSFSANSTLADKEVIVATGSTDLEMIVNYSGVTSLEMVTALNLDSKWTHSDWTAINGGSASMITSAITGNSVAGSAKYSGTTLAIIRSKKNESGEAYYSGASAVEISNVSGALNDFNLSSSSSSLSAYTNGLTLTMDETKENYIGKVLGKDPKVIEDTVNLYVEEVYPHFVRQAVVSEEITGIADTLGYDDSSDAFMDYNNDYTHSITPWIVSKVVAGNTHRLFKFHTISDGNESAKEIKISIANIDEVNYRFDVVVRQFSDTDATAGATALERFSNVTLDENQPNYLGKVIGTMDEEYPSRSNFILVEFATRFPDDTVPAGFEGYKIKGDAVTSADIYYKTEYSSGDTIYKTYLGTSELGYSSLTVADVSTRNSIKTLEKDLFKFHGKTAAGLTKIRGFHLENQADPAYFVSGNKSKLSDYEKPSLPGITDKSQLKFTVVPTGGFDGFNKYEIYETPNGQFLQNKTENVKVFKEAIDVFNNPEETDINLLATPGVDFYNNLDIVRHALNMVEERTDALYIIDSPRVTVSDRKGTPEEVVDKLQTTGIDSNYATTYWPWIQIEDTISGKYTYQAPTLFAVKVMALTDNVAAPWIAPAGLNRGLAGTSIKRTDIKLNKSNRDTLYGGRINPITSRVQQGIAIWGQKTLQIRESALDRINVRRLLLQVRRLVAAASLTLLFEQNDQALRDQFLAKVEPILLQIQNQRGLTAFRVVMDDSNNTDETVDRNTLVGKIQLKPTRTAEFIDLTFQVLPTGANFEDF